MPRLTSWLVATGAVDPYKALCKVSKIEKTAGIKEKIGPRNWILARELGFTLIEIGRGKFTREALNYASFTLSRRRPTGRKTSPRCSRGISALRFGTSLFFCRDGKRKKRKRRSMVGRTTYWCRTSV